MSPSFTKEEMLSLYDHVDEFLKSYAQICEVKQQEAMDQSNLPLRYWEVSSLEMNKKIAEFGQSVLHPIETVEGIVKGLHKVGQLIKPLVEFMGHVEFGREHGNVNLELANQKYEQFAQNISNIQHHLQNLSPEDKIKFATDLVFDFKVAPVLISKAGKVASALTKASKELVQSQNLKKLAQMPVKLRDLTKFSEECGKRAQQLDEVIERSSKSLNSAIKGLTITEEAAVQLWNESTEFAELNKIVNNLEKVVPNTKTISLEYQDLHVDKYLKIQEKAEKFYSTIRNNSHDIKLISQNTKIPIKIIEKIKNHIFYENHILKDGIRRFHAYYDIEVAWQRLIDGNFIKSDLKLLQHEFAELLILRGTIVDYETGHALANKIADWETLLKNN